MLWLRVHVSKCVFCLIYYNCIIILLSITVFVCHDKGNRFLLFLYNKFTSICILETINIFQPYHMLFTVFDLSMGRSANI